MIDLKIALTDGETSIETVEHYDPIEMSKEINNRQEAHIAIGTSIINKGMIKKVSPVEEV